MCSQLVGISAIILANLCVSYIMTSHTEEVRSWQCGDSLLSFALSQAEEIMKKIEKEEVSL